LRWQEIAMEAILQALDQTPRKTKKTVLNSRLEKLLTNHNFQSGKTPPQAAPSPTEVENAKRLQEQEMSKT
jgi:hypothetical protein